MKRIALISYHTCPLSAQEGKEIGGMNVYVLSLAKELVKAGNQVDIFTRAQDATQEHIVQVTPGLRVIHIIGGPEQSLPKKGVGAYQHEFTANLVTFITKEQTTYDVLDCHYYLSGLIGLALKKTFPHIPLLITFHTLALMKNLVARDDSEKESQERIDAEMELVMQAQKVISTGESDAQYLEYLYNCPKEKIAIVTPGVDTTVFTSIDSIQAKEHIGADVSDKVILFVGRIEPLKGIDVLLYALKILREKYPLCKVCLWIVGGDISLPQEHWTEELQKLEELRKVLGIETYVKFVGRQLPEALPYFYNAAELVVMPSQYESFGMTALEAMACGTPVIMTDATGVSDFLDEEHSALITSANNPLLLAEQMEYLLQHTEARNELGKNVQQKVQNLRWEKVAEKVTSIYNKL